MRSTTPENSTSGLLPLSPPLGEIEFDGGPDQSHSSHTNRVGDSEAGMSEVGKTRVCSGRVGLEKEVWWLVLVLVKWPGSAWHRFESSSASIRNLTCDDRNSPGM